MRINYALLGSYVRRYRRMQNLTQEDLADKVNVSAVYISQIENGKAKPGLELLIYIADTLDVSMDLLLIGNQRRLPDASGSEFDILCADCDFDERSIIFDAAMTVKGSLRRHKRILQKNCDSGLPQLDFPI